MADNVAEIMTEDMVSDWAKEKLGHALFAFSTAMYILSVKSCPTHFHMSWIRMWIHQAEFG